MSDIFNEIGQAFYNLPFNTLILGFLLLCMIGLFVDFNYRSIKNYGIRWPSRQYIVGYDLINPDKAKKSERLSLKKMTFVMDLILLGLAYFLIQHINELI